MVKRPFTEAGSRPASGPGRFPPAILIALVCMLLVPGCEGDDRIPGVDPSRTHFAIPDRARLPYFKTRDLEVFWTSDPERIRNEAHTIEEFQFTDQAASPFGSPQIENKIVVASFFFTRCSGICPALMSRLKQVQSAYLEDPDVLILSYSVTPDIDSPPVLAEYARNRGIRKDRWRLLTGAKTDIYRVARDSFQADTSTRVDQSLMDFVHSERIYLLDGQRRLRGVYNGNTPAAFRELIADIALLKKSG